MNLFFKSKRFYLIFFLLCAMESLRLLGLNTSDQQYLYPRLLQFNVPEKSVTTPYTSFVYRNDGFMLLSGLDGILVMHGQESYMLNMPGPVFLSTVDGETVYYLAEKDLGTLELFPHTPPRLISLRKDIPSHASSFYPYNCVASDSAVFMATSEGVFVVKQNSVRHHFLNRKACRLIAGKKTVFVQAGDLGTLKYENNEFVPVDCSVLDPGETITSVLDWQNTTYVFTSSDHVLECSDTVIREAMILPPELRGIQKTFLLPGNRFLAIDLDHQSYVLSPGQKILNIPGASGDLPMYMLNAVYNDAFNDSWLLYDFGLYKMEYPSVSGYLDLPRELKGTILASVISHNSLYLATTKGLAWISLTGREGWAYNGIISSERDEYLHLLKTYGNLVVAAGNRSLYSISEGACAMIDEGNFSSVCLHSDTELFACNVSGLFHYLRKGTRWEKRILLENVQPIRDMVLYRGTLWVTNAAGEVLTIDPENPQARKMDVPSGISPVKIFEYSSSLYLASKNELFRWSANTSSFVPEKDRQLLNAFANSTSFAIDRDNAWFTRASHQQVIYLNRYHPDGGTAARFGFSVPGSIQRMIDINTDGKYVWITGENGIIRVNTEFRKTGSADHLRIDKAYLRNPDKEAGVPLKPGDRIQSNGSQVVFEVMNTRYMADPEPLFRFRMPPHQKEWSEWDVRRTVGYGNLKSSHFDFQAQMMDITGEIIQSEVFSFSIQPPFYASWYAFLLYALILLFSAFLIYKWRLLGLQKVQVRMEAELQEKMDVLLREKDKSDRLLADLLPKGTAEELKSKGRAKSQKFEMVTVLFSDIQGFSHIAEEMNPEILIDELDKFFFHFDSVVEKYNIEKIKTIGDAYMAAGGIPQKNTTNPVEVVLAGIEMQYYMAELKKSKADIWDLRIGIHTGPVISGVVGHKRLSYDIWGDTVNTASRMESSGEAGRVNISGVTYALVKDYFICEYRGKLPVKYKGNIDMYFVNGLRPELSVDLHGIPNRRFFLKIQLLHLNDLEDYVFNTYLNEYPVTLHFHNKSFLKRVYDHSELLCRAENISEEDILLARTAALLMYTGLKTTYENYEIRSAEYAREVLPEYGYNEGQVTRIYNLILATREPYDPRNVLEQVLIDSKMEYLGRPDYIRMVKLLYLEYKTSGRELPIKEICQMQSVLQDSFSYFTFAAQRLREIPPEEQKKQLKTLEASI
jgi:class 3 adenylate cyclase